MFLLAATADEFDYLEIRTLKNVNIDGGELAQSGLSKLCYYLLLFCQLNWILIG